MITHNGEPKEHLRAKLISLLPLAFEAVLFTHKVSLSILDALSEIITIAQNHMAPKSVYNTFADYILSSYFSQRVPGGDSMNTPYIEPQSAAKLICKIVAAIRALPEYDTTEASRWIRCVVEMIAQAIKAANQHSDDSDSPVTRETCLSLLRAVLDQAFILAQSSYASLPGPLSELSDASVAVYPTIELEFLATTVFNLAVDFYIQGMDDLAKEWARVAVDVARLLQTENVGSAKLFTMLEDKMKALGWI